VTAPDRPVSAAFFLACSALAAAHGKPLPKGLVETTVGDWQLALNTTDDPLPFRGQDLPPLNVYAENTVAFGFALFGPWEGLIAGLDEARFIDDLAAAGFTLDEAA
jgi:hypothetical protein